MRHDWINVEVLSRRTSFDGVSYVVSLQMLQIEELRFRAETKVVTIRPILYVKVMVVVVVRRVENSRRLLLVMVEHIILVRIRVELLLRKVRVIHTVQHLQFPIAAYSGTRTKPPFDYELWR